MGTLPERLDAVRDRIARAARRARRNPSEIILLAVTKRFPTGAVREAYGVGLREFGENYVREIEGKAPEVQALEGARFHLIGHLQSNKSGKAAELFQVIQTVDSPKLAHRLNEAGRRIEVMLEVKLSAGAGQERRRPGGTGAVDCGRARVRQLAADGADDHAALVGGCGGVAPLFPPAAGTGGTARGGGAFDGHVARSGSGHRGRGHLREGGNGAVRRTEQGVRRGPDRQFGAPWLEERRRGRRRGRPEARSTGGIVAAR